MGSSLKSVQRSRFKLPHKVSPQDILVYEAIVGRQPSGASAAFVRAVEPAQPVHAETRRAWPADVAQASERVREIFEMGIASGVKKPEMAQWLRHMSGEAFRRLEEAQIRLSAARKSTQARHVEARVIRPPSPHSGDYKQVA